MIDIDELLPQILPYAPNAADVVMYRCIRETVREMCNKADIWSEAASFDITDTGEIAISPFEADVEIKKIKAADMDGVPLTPKAHDWLDERYLGWDREGAQEGQARFITQMAANSVIVVPRMAGKLTVRAILRPSLKAMTLPDFLVENYGTEIGQGAAGRVLMLPNDDSGPVPAMAGMLLGNFNAFLDTLPMKAFKGQQGARPRTKASFF